MDFSDNEIMKLENFPVLRRLSSLYLNNNRIRHIARGLGRALPRLQTLVLTNNQLARLEDLNALQDLPSLLGQIDTTRRRVIDALRATCTA